MSAAGITASSARHGADALATDAPATLARLRAFHTLDALRGVAALVVLLFHASFAFGFARPAEGYLAVDLFFAMSGFVIAYRYEADLGRGLGLGAFVGLRLRRLYPLFLLGTGLGLLPALAAVASGQADPVHEGLVAALPAALLMLPSHAVAFARHELYPLNFVSWSLMLELLVNVAWAATRRVWTVCNLVGLLVVAGLGLCAVAWAEGSLDAGHDWGSAWCGLPRVAYGFGVGVLVFKLRGLGPRFPLVPWWALVALVPAVLFLDPSRLGPVWTRPVFDVAFVVVVVPAILRAAVASEPPKAAWGVCALAGTHSYVLYSLHIGFVGLYLRLEERMHLDLATTSLPRGIAFAVGLAAFCFAAHAGYDRPVRRWLAGWHSPSRPARATAGG